MLRLSGTLAFLDWAWTGGPEPQAIDRRHVEAAVALWRDYYWPHARAALRQMGITDKHADARRVLRWLKAKRKTEVSREEVRVEALGKRHDADQVQTIIDFLVRAGWLRERTVPTAGRHARRWDVNPQLHSPWAFRKGRKGREGSPHPPFPTFPTFPEGAQGIQMTAPRQPTLDLGSPRQGGHGAPEFRLHCALADLKIPLQAILALVEYLEVDESRHFARMQEADADTRAHIFNHIKAVSDWLETQPGIPTAAERLQRWTRPIEDAFAAAGVRLVDGDFKDLWRGRGEYMPRRDN